MAQIDLNELANAIHGIRQMTLVALGAVENMVGSKVEPGFSRLRDADAEMVDFAICDLVKRLDELTDQLTEAGAPVAA